MGASSKRSCKVKKPSVPFEDGATVVESRLGYWSGSDWVQTLGEAKMYRPCTTEVDYGLVEAFEATGVKGFVFYWQPLS